MKAYRVELVLAENGVLTLTGLPFHAGESVEIIVLEHPEKSATTPPVQEFPLAGKVLRYEDPFEPATAAEDWDILR